MKTSLVSREDEHINKCDSFPSPVIGKTVGAVDEGNVCPEVCCYFSRTEYTATFMLAAYLSIRDVYK